MGRDCNNCKKQDGARLLNNRVFSITGARIIFAVILVVTAILIFFGAAWLGSHSNQQEKQLQHQPSFPLQQASSSSSINVEEEDDNSIISFQCVGNSKTVTINSQEFRDPVTGKCIHGTPGWKITGYFLPLEVEYPNSGGQQQYYVLGTRADGSYDYDEQGKFFYLQYFPHDFISAVTTEGAGETVAPGYTEEGLQSKILQSWKYDFIYPKGIQTRYYHYEECIKTSSGLCIPNTSSSLDEPFIVVAATMPQMQNLTKRDLEQGVLEYGDLIRIPNLPVPWRNATYYVADIGSSWSDKHIDIFTGRGKAAESETEKITRLDYSGIVIYLGNSPISKTQK